jgi:hypothetical protein
VAKKNRQKARRGLDEMSLAGINGVHAVPASGAALIARPRLRYAEIDADLRATTAALHLSLLTSPGVERRDLTPHKRIKKLKGIIT